MQGLNPLTALSPDPLSPHPGPCVLCCTKNLLRIKYTRVCLAEDIGMASVIQQRNLCTLIPGPAVSVVSSMLAFIFHMEIWHCRQRRGPRLGFLRVVGYVFPENKCSPGLLTGHTDRAAGRVSFYHSSQRMSFEALRCLWRRMPGSEDSTERV